MTPNIPLVLKLKKKIHKDIAYAQDIVVEEIYKFFPTAIFHGGTSIWRCYNGNRFSGDIDLYLPKEKKIIENFFDSLKKKGFEIIKKRIKENSIYSEIMINGTQIRVEATFQTKESILKKYETSEGFFINVYTLTSEDLILEKIEAYLKRKKIRDLYDIFFLLSYVQENRIKEDLKKLIKNFIKPEDEENLKAIIITGAVPTYEQLFEAIKEWAR